MFVVTVVTPGTEEWAGIGKTEVFGPFDNREDAAVFCLLHKFDMDSPLDTVYSVFPLITPPSEDS